MIKMKKNWIEKIRNCQIQIWRIWSYENICDII